MFLFFFILERMLSILVIVIVSGVASSLIEPKHTLFKGGHVVVDIESEAGCTLVADIKWYVEPATVLLQDIQKIALKSHELIFWQGEQIPSGIQCYFKRGSIHYESRRRSKWSVGVCFELYNVLKQAAHVDLNLKPKPGAPTKVYVSKKEDEYARVTFSGYESITGDIDWNPIMPDGECLLAFYTESCGKPHRVMEDGIQCQYKGGSILFQRTRTDVYLRVEICFELYRNMKTAGFDLNVISKDTTQDYIYSVDGGTVTVSASALLSRQMQPIHWNPSPPEESIDYFAEIGLIGHELLPDEERPTGIKCTFAGGSISYTYPYGNYSAFTVGLCLKLYEKAKSKGVDLKKKTEVYLESSRIAKIYGCGSVTIEDSANNCGLTIKAIKDVQSEKYVSLNPCVSQTDLKDSPKSERRFIGWKKLRFDSGLRSLVCLIEGGREFATYTWKKDATGKGKQQLYLEPKTGWFNNYERFCEILYHRIEKFRNENQNRLQLISNIPIKNF